MPQGSYEGGAVLACAILEQMCDVHSISDMLAFAEGMLVACAGVIARERGQHAAIEVLKLAEVVLPEKR